MNGKGSKYRTVNGEKFRSEYDRIFSQSKGHQFERGGAIPADACQFKIEQGSEIVLPIKTRIDLLSITHRLQLGCI